MPGRTHDGQVGALVLTPLRVASTGAVLPVVRGWVPSVDDPAATAPPPTGEVTVVGWLKVGEAAGQGGLPDGQTDAISPAELVNRWGGPTYSGYLVLDTVDAAQAPGLVALGYPARDGWGRGLAQPRLCAPVVAVRAVRRRTVVADARGRGARRGGCRCRRRFHARPGRVAGAVRACPPPRARRCRA